MKHIITTAVIVLATILSSNVYGQEFNLVAGSTKFVTTSCTISKPVKLVISPELDSTEGDFYKDGVSITIKWTPIDNGGICEASINFGEEYGSFPINRWRDYDDLFLMRVKTTDGHYNYMLRNHMFVFWGLVYLESLGSYAFDSTIKECD